MLNDDIFRPSVPQMIEENRQHSEDENEKPSLSDSARSKFIVKVFALVTLQLLLTSVIAGISYNNRTFSSWLITPSVYIISSIGLITISIIISCCTNFFRKFALPLFVLFTLFASFLVSMSIYFESPQAILLAFLATFILTFSLTIYACISDNI